MEQPATPDVGTAIKETQKGHLPIGTVEAILKAAPNDILEDTIDVPEWGCAVRVRSFSAAQSSNIRQLGFAFRGEETAVAWAMMEMMQFKEGVIEPEFTDDQVKTLHMTSGAGFARVIKWLDDHSGLDKEAMEKARAEFQG